MTNPPVHPPVPIQTPIVDEEGRQTPNFFQVNTQGFSGTITTAKLTPGGTEGSMLFSFGKLISQVKAT